MRPGTPVEIATTSGGDGAATLTAAATAPAASPGRRAGGRELGVPASGAGRDGSTAPREVPLHPAMQRALAHGGGVQHQTREQLADHRDDHPHHSLAGRAGRHRRQRRHHEGTGEGSRRGDGPGTSP
jgi:hypothetical protein